LWLLADQHAATTIMDALVGHPGLHVLVALITLGLGLAMVLGWGMLLRGLLLLFLSPDQVRGLGQTLRFSTFLYALLALPLVLGFYLTYAGFTIRSSSSA